MDNWKALTEIRAELRTLAEGQKITRELIGEAKKVKDRTLLNEQCNLRTYTRPRIRVLHLAACFLRGTPYKKVENDISDDLKHTTWLWKRQVKQALERHGVEVTGEQLQTWIYGTA